MARRLTTAAAAVLGATAADWAFSVPDGGRSQARERQLTRLAGPVPLLGRQSLAPPGRELKPAAAARAAAGEPAPASAQEPPTGRRWWPACLGAVVGAGAAVARRVASHRLPARRAQSPIAEVAFGLLIYGTLREVVRSYFPAADSFRLREDLFKEMAVAQTYKNSLWPWIQTGSIALIVSLFIIFGIKAFIRSMKDWEEQQERKEMSQMGQDASFLMSVPVDAIPLDKKKARMKRRLTPWYLRFIGSVADFLWVLRIGACTGYLLPLLNVLDFGEISISLNPYPLGVPASEPLVNFMQNTLKMRFLYSAYLKSGYYFLIVWFVFIQLFMRNKAMPYFFRFHSAQAILISTLLGPSQQVFFAVLNPWDAGLVVQTIMYHSMVSIFFFTVVLVMYCCARALMKQTMQLPLLSEAAKMWSRMGTEDE